MMPALFTRMSSRPCRSTWVRARVRVRVRVRVRAVPLHLGV